MRTNHLHYSRLDRPIATITYNRDTKYLYVVLFMLVLSGYEQLVLQ